MQVPSASELHLQRAPLTSVAPEALPVGLARPPATRAKPTGRSAEASHSWFQAVCGFTATCWSIQASRRGKAACQAAKKKQKASSGSDADIIVEPEHLESALRVMRQETSALMRFLSSDSSLSTEFENMQPLLDTPGVLDMGPNGRSPLADLNQMRAKGSIHSVESTTYRLENKLTAALAVCNVDAGVICGFGVSTNAKRARQLAAQQALTRVTFPAAPTTELVRAAGDNVAAQQAAEAMEALKEHLDNVRLTITQPYGATWKAILQGQIMGRRLVGNSPSACETQDAAVASAGEQFLTQVRSALRLRSDAPHAPEEWADALTFKGVQTTLRLDTLGGGKAESTLLELIGTDDDRDARAKALQEATDRQSVRDSLLDEVRLHSSQERNDAGTSKPCAARRCYKVQDPDDETWRREEIKGQLPAEQVREELGKALEYNQVVIVSGGTGSGKSTQLPQFILDDFTEWEVVAPEGEKEEALQLEVGMVVEVEFEEVWYACDVLGISADGETITAKYHEGGDEEPDIDVESRVRKAKPHWTRMKPRIVVTQPRRIAATSLAQRVAWERYQEVGEEIGHAVRGDSVFPNSETGTIEFCTVGTLLRRLITDPLLDKYNVVVLDEVHERDLMTDFLLVLLREVLSQRPDIRLVLMSATLDVQTFVNYLPGNKVIEVPSGTRYPVDEIHLDDDFFASFRGTNFMLESEAASRQAAEITRTGTHDWGVADAVDTKQALEKQIEGLVDSDEEMEKAWEKYCDESLEGEREVTKHSAEVLKAFISQADAEGAGDSGPSKEVLQEQILQLMSYSDEFRQAWSDHCGSDDASKALEEREADELMEFLAAQGVRPWNGGRASWEVTSSLPWWGSDANDTTFLGLAEETIHRIVPEMLNEPVDDEHGVGAILCFLPGWGEIRSLAKRLEDSTSASKLWVLRLHSTVTREEQQQIFEPAPEGKVKVILGTNIAESSVTINDVRVVVDSGLHREVSYDPKRRMSYLETVWICQSNAVQRKGRAGRVRAGRVFRLYSREQFEAVPWRPAPEMQRCNLAQTCLQTIALKRDPRDFLAAAPDPPVVASVEAAMAELTSIEAIKEMSPAPRMLPVGQILCRLPLEPLLGRAMILGTLFGVPQSAAALLAVSAGRSPFLLPPDKRKEARAVQREYCSWSDTIATLRALNEFEWIYKEKGEFAAKQWAEYYFLNFQRLLNLSRIKYQLVLDVQRSGILTAATLDGLNPDEWFGFDEDEEEGEYEDEHADSDGSIFETSEVSPAGLGMRDWISELKNSTREVENEQLLVGILCSAYPTNVAVRERPQHRQHQTASTSKAVIDLRSVNWAQGKQENDEITSDLPSPSWWLYSDLRMFNGQVTLCDTTQLNPWQVGIFGGLRNKGEEEIMLDHWITVECDSPETASLVRHLREEIRQAMVWVSIATSWDKVAQAAVGRAKSLFRVLGCVLTNQEPDDEDLEYLRDWQLPTVDDDGPALEADEDEREDVEEKLWTKTVAELKALLKELNVKVSGRKADLVQRCADALIYGAESTGEAVDEFRDELADA